MTAKIEITETETIYGMCACCLNNGYLKSMWKEHGLDSDKEVYGRMLLECFVIPMEFEVNVDDRICSSCIEKLRDAWDFRKLFIQSRERKQSGPVKLEIEIMSESSDGEEYHMDSNVEYLDEELLDRDEEGSLEQCEEQECTESPTPMRRKRRSRQPPPPSCKTKWPKKLPVKERFLTYKQYTPEDLKNCLEDIRNNMSVREAAMKYNIPEKTLSNKIRAGVVEQEELPTSRFNEFIAEIKRLLEHTNMTPFKMRFNKIYCGFCPHRPHFEDPDSLRNHTFNHPNRLKKVSYLLKPFYYNEMLRVDIKDLKCLTCDLDLEWNEIFEHLKEFHNEHLEISKKFVVPFILDDKIQCALCAKFFSAYKILDIHINSHFPNYKCSDCGDTYVTATRCKTHKKIHEAGIFTCEECGKTFNTKAYLSKHKSLSHDNKPLYKCNYCAESFRTEKYKQLHMISYHEDKVKKLKCPICEDTFLWEHLYRKHLFKQHNGKLTCNVCDKVYSRQSELKLHMARHEGVNMFPCALCPKNYSSFGGLKYHMEKHAAENDREPS